MEDDFDLHSLFKRLEEAKNYKLRWLALYSQLYQYVIPDRNAFNEIFGYRDDGLPTTQQIWDSTAMISAYQRANDLHGLLMPSDRVWGKMVLDPHLYPQELIDKSQTVVDEINDRIFFYIGQSNINRAVSSSNLDLSGGTGALWVESVSDETPVYFRSIPAVSLFIEYSTDDLINTCWFVHKMTARSVLKTFPKYKGKLYDRLISNPDEVISVYYGQIKVTESHFFIYGVLEGDPYSLLFEREKTYQQIIVYRDKVRPGEAEGRGIGLDMLPNIIDLNKIVQYSRKSMAFKANPLIFYDAGDYINPYSLRQISGAWIPRKPNGRNPLEAFQMPEYPEVLQHILYLREAIQKAFQVDPLGEIQSPVRSATEVSIRENRAQRTSATDISRLINELPRQVYEVTAKILNERNLLTKNRKAIPGFSPSKFTFEFQSPLYDLQKQDDLNHFITNLQIKQQFYGPGSILATSNIYEVNKFLSDKTNLPRKLFASDEDIKRFMEEFNKQQQAGQFAPPKPTTSAGSVKFPEQPQVTI